MFQIESTDTSNISCRRISDIFFFLIWDMYARQPGVYIIMIRFVVRVARLQSAVITEIRFLRWKYETDEAKSENENLKRKGNGDGMEAGKGRHGVRWMPTECCRSSILSLLMHLNGTAVKCAYVWECNVVKHRAVFVADGWWSCFSIDANSGLQLLSTCVLRYKHRQQSGPLEWVTEIPSQHLHRIHCMDGRSGRRLEHTAGIQQHTTTGYTQLNLTII